MKLGVNLLLFGDAPTPAVLRRFADRKTRAATAKYLKGTICAAAALGLTAIHTAKADTLPDTPGNAWAVDGAVNAIAVDGERVYLGGSFTHAGPVLRGGSAGMLLLDAATGQRTWHINGFSNAGLVISDETGGWYVGGGDSTTGWVVHVLSNQIVDPGFAVPLEHIPSALLLYSGKLHIGGGSVAGGATPYYLLAVDPSTGTVDPAWHPVLAATDDRYNYEARFYTMAAGGGQVYIGGFFQSVNGSTRTCLAAVDATTGATTSWNPNLTDRNLTVKNAEVYALAVANSKVYIGGEFKYIGGVLHNFLGAVNATTGAVDPTWNPISNNKVSCVVASGGRVYLIGNFSTMGGTARNRAAAVAATTGALDPWNPNVVGGAPVNYAISGSNVYMIGLLSSVGGATRCGAALVDATNGVANLSWHPDPYPNPRGLAVSGTNVCLVGSFAMLEQEGAVVRSNLVALSVRTGALDPSWNPGASGPVNALAVSGSKVYVGGNFTTVGGLSRSYLAAVDATNGVVDPVWNPGASNQVNALAVSGGKVYFGGAFTKAGGLPRNYLAAVDSTNGVVDPAWNPGASNQVYALAVSGSRVYAGGIFTKVGGVTRRYLAALDATTGVVDPVWDAAITNENQAAGSPGVKALAVSGGKVYAGGYFTKVGGLARNWLAAVDATTGAITSWNPGIRDGLWAPGGPYNYSSGMEVRSLVVLGDKVVAGGSFTNVAGMTYNGLAAVDASTGALDSWKPSNFYVSPNVSSYTYSYAYPNALAVSSNGLWVGHSDGVAQYGPTADILLSISVPTGQPLLNWTEAKRTVYVDFRPSLTSGGWQQTNGPFAVSVCNWLVNPGPVASQGFFRIRQP